MNIPKNIPKNAQLIKGLGASSWFTIIAEKQNYRIERFSKQGELEFSWKTLDSNFSFTFSLNVFFASSYIFLFGIGNSSGAGDFFDVL